MGCTSPPSGVGTGFHLVRSEPAANVAAERQHRRQRSGRVDASPTGPGSWRRARRTGDVRRPSRRRRCDGGRDHWHARTRRRLSLHKLRGQSIPRPVPVWHDVERGLLVGRAPRRFDDRTSAATWTWRRLPLEQHPCGFTDNQDVLDAVEVVRGGAVLRGRRPAVHTSTNATTVFRSLPPGPAAPPNSKK